MQIICDHLVTHAVNLLRGSFNATATATPNNADSVIYTDANGQVLQTLNSVCILGNSC